MGAIVVCQVIRIVLSCIINKVYAFTLVTYSTLTAEDYTYNKNHTTTRDNYYVSTGAAIILFMHYNNYSNGVLLIPPPHSLSASQAPRALHCPPGSRLGPRDRCAADAGRPGSHQHMGHPLLRLLHTHHLRQGPSRQTHRQGTMYIHVLAHQLYDFNLGHWTCLITPPTYMYSGLLCMGDSDKCGCARDAMKARPGPQQRQTNYALDQHHISPNYNQIRPTLNFIYESCTY